MVCLVLGQVLHPVVFPVVFQALLLVLHQVGVLNLEKMGKGMEIILGLFWPLHCKVAPIFHNRCSKNQPKGILNSFLHHLMWCSSHFFHCILAVLNFALVFLDVVYSDFDSDFDYFVSYQ